MRYRDWVLPACAALALVAQSTAQGQELHQEQDVEDLPAITVFGRGEAAAGPDMAHIQVGVVTEAETAAAALAANNEAVDGLFDTLDELGIAQRDIQTSHFGVSPVYRHDDEGRRRPEIVGYSVNNQVSVRVRKLAGLGRLLDELVSQGANQVMGISFAVDKDEAVLDEARKAAIQDARRKAELYAEAAGVRLGRVLAIEETRAGFPRPMGDMARMAMAESAVPVATGEQQFEASVTVRYAIE